MNLGEIRARFRQRVDDLQPPYLWGQEEVDAYANEAVAEAAERAFLIFEAIDPRVSRIMVRPEQYAYDLHPAIVRIDRVSNIDSQVILAPTEVAELSSLNMRGDLSGDPAHYAAQGGKIMFYPMPATQPAHIHIAAYRVPMDPMAHEQDEPEIEARLHERLIDWMAYRAYSKRDADAYDARRAQNALMTFAANFGIRDDADTQRKKAEHRRPVAAFNAAWGMGHQSRSRR